MVPLLILLISFLVLTAINQWFLKKRWSYSLTGRLAMSIMLLFTGTAHFTSTSLMVEMMPGAVPWKELLVYFTGLLEWLAALALPTKRWGHIGSWFLLLFFLAILPANIAGSLKGVPLGGMEKGVGYLYFRIPLQLLFMFWVYLFGIRMNQHTN